MQFAISLPEKGRAWLDGFPLFVQQLHGSAVELEITRKSEDR
jgi:hypothetical protein